jgi:hypothetical protein
VMFRGRAQYAGFTPREGDKVEVRALVTLYGAREVGDFTPDPDQGEGAFEQARHLLVEGGNAQHGRCGVGGIGVVGTEHMDEL